MSERLFLVCILSQILRIITCISSAVLKCKITLATILQKPWVPPTARSRMTGRPQKTGLRPAGGNTAEKVNWETQERSDPPSSSQEVSVKQPSMLEGKTLPERQHFKHML